MKVQPKDDIIYRLMLALKRDNMSSINTDKVAGIVTVEEKSFLINKGWIDALEWVLNIKVNYGQYTKDDIINAVDIAVGDDGLRSKEVIAILEEENNG